jgi:HSP20 family protein
MKGEHSMAENTSTLVKNRPEKFNAESTRNGNYFTPRVDIIETENELLLYADMPGVRQEDVDLRYENGELILRGKVQPTQVAGNLIFAEYEAGDFYRVFQVHETINASKIDAEFKNGVLTVHLPKQEAAKPKQVTIRTQ